MKRLKKGPEINLSKLKSGDLKPPKAIGDLYLELKNQHLLPIVALLVVGLIAVPLLVGGSSDHHQSEGAGQPAIGGSTKEAALKVTRWTPGLLDYKKTLRGATAGNPFLPKVSEVEEEPGTQEVEAPPAPSEIKTETGGGEGSESPGSTPETTPHSPEEGNGEEGNRHGEEAGHNETGAITVDVQVTTVHEEGGVDRAPVRRELPQLTKLPSEAIPALTYVGPSEDRTKALMAVSSEVTAMIGDSKCVVHAEPCSLLALQVGAPETIVYGSRGLTYRIELVRIGDHTSSAGNAKAHPGGVKGGGGNGPAPRGEADALIGVGSRHVVEDSSGLSASGPVDYRRRPRPSAQ
jgi:hypothetical protein